MILLVVALFGFLVPNGFFLYWLVNEFLGVRPIVADHLAMGFILDAFMAMIILAVYFARHPIGPVRWPVFVILSIVGGLGFSLPFYWWINTHRSRNRAVASNGSA
jgi:hypothetical protein